jgi:hypothetical protein
MGLVMTQDRHQPIADEVPMADEITEYDLGHLEIYLQLLAKKEDGASEEELCLEVLHIDPAREPERARKVLEQHLERARWMTVSGYRHLARMRG